ncbi:hypothetical protein OQJ19_11875 [Fluoribacter gormanii]|uniref:hypothetical protein n=2 Tax=Fluoribacter gormanii TaxID=464 RepID=UPI002244551B|nr:hypothetical protein [Fluoribacter gormanii]MCW8471344.1 hypothetical protein [Fluoribacter gormanii]
MNRILSSQYRSIVDHFDWFLILEVLYMSNFKYFNFNEQLEINEKEFSFINSILNVDAYPLAKTNKCLSQEEFSILNSEIRNLALKSLGSVPEYQVFVNDYSLQQDKIIVTHRNKKGELNGVASAVIVKSDNVDDYLHYGIFLVDPASRHQHIQFKLGVSIMFNYMKLYPNKEKLWITNVSSVLGTLAVIDKMFLDVYPGMKLKTPRQEHAKICKDFIKGAYERCYLNPKSNFDQDEYVFKEANLNNCFKKKASNKQFNSLSNSHNKFYSNLMNQDQGDAVLQIGYITKKRIYMTVLFYLYRAYIRNLFVSRR